MNAGALISRAFVVTAVAAGLLLFPGPSAAETRAELGMNISVLGSDNIDRTPPGTEKSGSIVSLTAGPVLEKTWRQNSLLFRALIGRESINAAVDETSTTYDGSLVLDLGGSQGPFFGLALAAARRSTLAEEDELSRGRSVRESRSATMRTGSNEPEGAGWSLAATGSEVETDGDPTNEVDLALDTSWKLSARSGLEIGSTVNNGEAEGSGNRWRGASAALSWTRRLAESSTAGFTLDWEGSELNPGGGGNDVKVHNTGIGAFWNTSVSSRSTFSGSLGYEWTAIRDGENESNPQARLALMQELSETVTLNTEGGYNFRQFIETDGTISWSRQTSLTASLAWAAGRRFRADVRAGYTEDVLLDDGFSAGRTDEASRLGLGGQWTLARRLRASLSAQNEVIRSSDPGFELEENRVEALLSGTF